MLTATADGKLFAETYVDGCLLLVFPHPSGISHFWNQPSNVTLAATTLRSVLRRTGLAEGNPLMESALVVPRLGEEEEEEDEEEFTQRERAPA